MGTHFETEICSRCHGSGKYSFCERYADRCFKCAGQTVVLTKRGAAAKTYLETLCSKPASSLMVGDRISRNSMTHGGSMYSYIATVTKVEAANDSHSGTVIDGQTVWTNNKNICITTEHPKYGIVGLICSPDSLVRTYPVDNAAKIAMALEYQAKLTKQGKPRKGSI